jgi:hypothetical protein
MTQTIITAGDATNGLVQAAGNDGTLVIQTGPNGAKVNALSIDAAGNVKSSALAAPAFSVYQTTPQAYAGAGTTVILHQAKEFDTANAYTPANGRFTAPVAGYYQFNATCYSPLASRSAETQLVLNTSTGLVYAGDDLIASSASIVTLSTLIFMAVGDWVNIGVYVQTGGTSGVAGRYTIFQGFLARSA